MRFLRDFVAFEITQHFLASFDQMLPPEPVWLKPAIWLVLLIAWLTLMCRRR